MKLYNKILISNKEELMPKDLGFLKVSSAVVKVAAWIFSSYPLLIK